MKCMKWNDSLYSKRIERNRFFFTKPLTKKPKWIDSLILRVRIDSTLKSRRSTKATSPCFQRKQDFRTSLQRREGKRPQKLPIPKFTVPPCAKFCQERPQSSNQEPGGQKFIKNFQIFRRPLGNFAVCWLWKERINPGKLRPRKLKDGINFFFISTTLLSMTFARACALPAWS